tara:strand:+ start:637 stop:1053 length:417 start_codon:yes stop_codon:yes gene_type:complete
MANAKMGASHGWSGNYVESAKASFSLVPGDSGKTIILGDPDDSNAAVTATLPALSDINAGFKLTLISANAGEHILNGGNSKIYGIAVNETTETAASQITRFSAASSVTLSGGMIGDKFDVISDGTNWYVYLLADAAAS